MIDRNSSIKYNLMILYKSFMYTVISCILTRLNIKRRLNLNIAYQISERPNLNQRFTFIQHSLFYQYSSNPQSYLLFCFRQIYRVSDSTQYDRISLYSVILQMSKQSSLDSFLKKKITDNTEKIRKDNNRKQHQSSREGSQVTQKLPDDEDIVELEVFKNNKLTCPVFILLTPAAMTYYASIQRSLRKFSNAYKKQDVLDFIKKNMCHHKVNNLQNLEKIKDDQFWCFTVPEMIELMYRHINQIGCKIKIMNAGFQGVIDLTRMQVFLILACMFFGILPKQVHEDSVHMGDLMVLRQDDLPNKISTRTREKLKCFIAYFKAVTQNKEFLQGNIRFQRTKNTNIDFVDPYRIDREIPLRHVEVHSNQNTFIEDYCGKGIMIDFANRRLGGGVLRGGCVQEQILFSIFPQATVSKVICQPLEDDQAVIIYGTRRFSKYSGYSDSFEFKGLVEIVSQSQAEKSVLVAIDAFNYTQTPNTNYQYSKKGVRRELCKANIGFQGAGLEANEEMPVVTGRWGCGVFKGDEELKFLIQWIAASEANRQMVYITGKDQSVKHFKLAYDQLKNCSTSDLLGILEQYGKVRPTLKNPMSVMQYIKNYT